MLCLYNGEYEEHNIKEFYASEAGAEKNLKRMEAEYKKYPGTVVGDFTCLKVEYDWGRRDQRWMCKCNLCGKIIYKYHTKDWRRGNGSKRTCVCRKEKAEVEKQAKAEEKSNKIAERQKEHLHKTYGGWEIIEYNGLSKCKIKCTQCGRIRNSIRLDDVINKRIAECNHKVPNDYSGDEWIGKRNGHLTTIGRDGGLFIVKCDCGQQTTARGTDLFTRKAKKSCGLVGCIYSTDEHIASIKRRTKGFNYEAEVEEMLKNVGIDANMTKRVGDFGVDIIITENDGSLTAIQCKKQDDPAGVEAIQEVYSGGRFYDCTNFAVICPSGYSNPAITMARKLGVYLSNGEYNPPENMREYAQNLLPTFFSNEGGKKYYELNGAKKTLSDWCVEYGTTVYQVKKNMKNGMSLEAALKYKGNNRTQYTIGEITATLTEICNHYGVLPQTVSYRMKHKGMTLEEAIFYHKSA